MTSWGYVGTSALEINAANSPYTPAGNSSENYVFNSGTMTISNAGTHSGTITGNGTITLDSSGRNQIHFSGSMSDFSGTVNVGGGAWFGISGNDRGSENVAWVVNTAQGDPTGLLPSEITNSAADPIKLGSLTGNGCIRPMGNQGGKMFYFQIGNLMTAGTTTTYAGLLRNYGNADLTVDDIHVEKVGAGKWILTGGNTFTGGLVVSEGEVQIGANSDNSWLNTACPVTVASGAAFGYSRSNSMTIANPITLEGGTFRNYGGSGNLTFNHLTTNGGGTIDYAAGGGGVTTIQDLTMNGEGRVTFDTKFNAINLTGTLKSDGSPNQEIYLTGARGNFLNVTADLSSFAGTITAGPSNNGSIGTWVVLKSAMDASKTTFNLIPGANLDAGLLLDYTPTATSVVKLGAVSGNGIVRLNCYAEEKIPYQIQIGGNNQNTTFSGGIQTFAGFDASVEKVGTGIWTITSDGTKYGNAINGSYKNNYTGKTTITEGTIRLGDYDPVTKTGGATGMLGYADGNNSSKLTPIAIGANGTLSIARNGSIDLYNNISSAAGGTIEVINPNFDTHVSLRGAISGTITKTGAGYLAIGSDNGANLVKIIVKEGFLRNWTANRLGNGATAIDLAGGTFMESTPDVVLSNKFTLVAGTTSTIIGRNGNDGMNFTISSNIVGAGNLTKDGDGTLYLTGFNDFTGTLTVARGVVQIGNNNSAYINNAAPVIVKEGAAFGYNRPADTEISPQNAVTVENGTLFQAGGRPVNFKNVTFVNGGTLKNTGTGKLTVNSTKATGVINFNGKNDGDLVLNLNSSTAAIDVGGFSSASAVNSIINFTSTARGNFLNLNGSMDSFHGTINVTGNCWFSFNSGTALGSANAVWNTTMTKDSGILFESAALNGKTVKMGDLTGNGWVRPGNLDTAKDSSVNLEVGALGNDSTFSGALRSNNYDGGKKKDLNVIKVGDGTWTLGSAGQVADWDYTNTANLIVRDGTLVLNRNAGQAAANNMTVEGGTLKIASNGQTISGALTMTGGSIEIANGVSLTKNVTVAGAENSVAQIDGNVVGNISVTSGILSPGAGADVHSIGELKVTGSLAFASTESLQIDVKSTTSFDRLKVDGQLILEEGQKIAVSVDDDFDGGFFHIGVMEIDEVKIGTQTYEVSEVDWGQILEMPADMLFEVNGNVVSLTQAPEPQSLALMIFGLGGLFLARNLRRKQSV